MYGRISDPGMTSYPPRVVLGLRTRGWGLSRGSGGWGFHTVRGVIDPWDRRFRPRFVAVVDVWKIFNQGMGPCLSPVVLAHAGSFGL